MDENEAESEADKQAALAGNDRNVNGNNWWGHLVLGAVVTIYFVFLLFWSDRTVNPSRNIVNGLSTFFSSEAFEHRHSGGRYRVKVPEMKSGCSVGLQHSGISWCICLR